MKSKQDIQERIERLEQNRKVCEAEGVNPVMTKVEKHALEWVLDDNE